MRYVMITTFLASLMSVAAQAGSCPATITKVTCTADATKDRGAEQMVITSDANGNFTVGAVGWAAGKNQGGENAFTLKTHNYGLDKFECDADVLDLGETDGTMVNVDCSTGKGNYAHFTTGNTVEQGKPCASDAGTLSSCQFE